jgi:hypothetical protein
MASQHRHGHRIITVSNTEPPFRLLSPRTCMEHHLCPHTESRRCDHSAWRRILGGAGPLRPSTSPPPPHSPGVSTTLPRQRAAARRRERRAGGSCRGAAGVGCRHRDPDGGRERVDGGSGRQERRGLDEGRAPCAERRALRARYRRREG